MHITIVLFITTAELNKTKFCGFLFSTYSSVFYKEFNTSQAM